jgi:internalin A
MAHAHQNQGDDNMDCDGYQIALERIAAEREARTGRLDLGGLGLSRLPEELFELEWLEHLVLRGGLKSRHDGVDNRIEGRLAEIRRLRRLSTLDCSATDLADLSPLAELKTLTELNFGGTRVSDLSPLKELRALTGLNCSTTNVSDLSPVAGLKALTWLNCSSSRLFDLSPLAELTALTWLDLGNTEVSNLSPLAALTALTYLRFRHTRVRDLQPLAKLSRLETLNCGGTEVLSLDPLAALISLTMLECSFTKVSDLRPLAALPRLRRLFCDCVRIAQLPSALVASPALEVLEITDGSLLSDIPPEVFSRFSKDGDDNCLPRLRAHLADVAAGAEPLRDVKVIVLGNGRIGKTQLCRRLRGLPFEEAADSTHGIGVSTAELPMPDRPPALLNLWDFGGQDIYHGTHALFMRTRAIFVVLWTPDSEQGVHKHGDLEFENQPLGYWLDYVRHLGGAQSPLLIVQNQCDGGLGRRPSPPDSPALQALAADGRCFQPLGYSAKDETGRDALLEALRLAVTALRGLQGQPMMGSNRLRVRDQLRAWRDADAALPGTAERRHRLVPFADFAALCEQQGVHDPPGYAEVLHRAGEVWYQPGHFGDRMILDQSWALREIYALFTREDGVHAILRGPGLAGRFTRPLLDRLLWGRPTAHREPLTAADQRVLLGLMEQSGICFAHRRGSKDADATEYVAPDLLPTRDTVARAIANRWEARTGGGAEAAFAFPFLTPAIARTVLSDLGDLAGEDADYWRYGLSLYDADTDAAAEIDEQPDAEGHGGRLALRTKGEQAGALLENLIDRIDKLNEHHGWAGRLERTVPGAPDTCLDPARSALEPPVHARRPQRHGPEGPAPLHPSAPPPSPPEHPEVYVSYNWRREAESPLVQGLCDALLARDGIRVTRERDEMNWGDSIRRFMQQLAAGRCVLVILSAEYLRSPFCMTELHGIWRAVGEWDEAFRRRIVPLVQDDAGIRTLAERLAHAKHWTAERKRLDELLRDCAPSEIIDLLGETGYAEWQRINGFCRDIVPMLTLADDMLLPRQPELLAADDFGAVRALIRERIA